MPPALLACSKLRIDVGGVPALDGLALTSSGDHVLVLGAARALFEAAAGLRKPTRGELLVEGLPASEAVRAGIAACAPCDPPLPSKWTVRQYVTWSARLSGHGRATALALAADALDRMQIATFATMKVGATEAKTRRAIVVAGAVATGATSLLLEDPTVGLRDDAARWLGRACMRALADRRTLVFAARMPLESPLALAADEAIAIDRSTVVAQAAPAEIAAREKTLSLRVHGNLLRFISAVERNGARAVADPWGRASLTHMRVELGPLAVRDLLRIAAESDALILEVRPLCHAFA